MIGVWHLLGWLHLRDALLWGSAWRGGLYFLVWRHRRRRQLRGEIDQTMSRWTRRRIIRYQSMPGVELRLDQAHG